jgi:hypothetical protein
MVQWVLVEASRFLPSINNSGRPAKAGEQADKRRDVAVAEAKRVAAPHRPPSAKSTWYIRIE